MWAQLTHADVEADMAALGAQPVTADELAAAGVGAPGVRLLAVAQRVRATHAEFSAALRTAAASAASGDGILASGAKDTGAKYDDAQGTASASGGNMAASVVRDTWADMNTPISTTYTANGSAVSASEMRDGDAELL